MIQASVLFLISLALACVLTPLVRTLAIQYGHVARPTQDRWHKTPTALLGGIAIFFAFVLPLLFFVSTYPTLQILVFGALLIGGVGLIDDLLHLQPYSKLIGQIVAACVVIAGGQALGLFHWSIYFFILALVWIVGVTNAFNLLDNMDGLSVGTACIAAFYLVLAGLVTSNIALVLGAASLMGATLGFLWFNFPPAKIFMGDSGSLLLGFILSSLALLGKWENATGVVFSLMIPVLVLAVPIFDTAFVSLVRFFNDRPISQGGRDHSSHRLVAFGLSERRTVLLFYAMSIICGALAILGLQYDWLYPSLLAVLIVIMFMYFGIFLSEIVTYGDAESKGAGASFKVSLNFFLKGKMRIGEILIDSILIAGSFLVAFLIRFDGLPSPYDHVLVQTLPLLIPLKLMAFFYFGMYRGIWRYVGIQDLIHILKAVTLSSLLSVVIVTMVFRFESYSRAVFFIDWMVLLLAVGGVRVAVRMIKEYLGAWVKPDGKRLLIMGAGDAGEIALREIRNNPTINYMPIGFIDDDRSKLGREIHGLRVMGSRMELQSVVQKHRVEEILVAIPSANKGILTKVLQDCRGTGVTIQILSRTRKLSSVASA